MAFRDDGGGVCVEDRGAVVAMTPWWAKPTLHERATRDHSWGAFGERAAVVVAPEVFDAQAVALEQELQFSREDAGHVEVEPLVFFAAEGVEPGVSIGDPHDLPR